VILGLREYVILGLSEYKWRREFITFIAGAVINVGLPL